MSLNLTFASLFGRATYNFASESNVNYESCRVLTRIHREKEIQFLVKESY